MTKPDEVTFKSVLKFMGDRANFHSDMIYDISRKGFILEKCSDKSPGIYFIVRKDTMDILKIGKADGKQGLMGRLQTYRSKLASRKNDKTVELLYKKMTGPLAGIPLAIYILPLPTETKEFYGLEVELQMARSLELLLSKQAKAEKHSMELSGQD